MTIPTTLKHKPVIVVENYEHIILRPSFGQEIKNLTNVCYLINRSKQDGKEQEDIHGFFQERSSA